MGLYIASAPHIPYYNGKIVEVSKITGIGPGETGWFKLDGKQHYLRMKYLEPLSLLERSCSTCVYCHPLYKQIQTCGWVCIPEELQAVQLVELPNDGLCEMWTRMEDK